MTWTNLSYNYSTGIWYDQGYMGTPKDWKWLSNIMVSADFMGDGLFHQTGFSTWWYGFNYGGGQKGEWWGPCGGSAGFFYDYQNGQWWTAGGKGSTPATFWGYGLLGTAGKSAQFMGDGSTYDLDGAHQFQFVNNSGESNCYGIWTGGLSLWRYDYAAGQWDYSVDGLVWLPDSRYGPSYPPRYPG